MKRMKMAYMLGMLLVQSMCIMSMDGENLNFQNLDDAYQARILMNAAHGLNPESGIEIHQLLRANENQPAGPAQEEAKEADEKKQADVGEEDTIETDTDHPSQR